MASAGVLGGAGGARQEDSTTAVAPQWGLGTWVHLWHNCQLSSTNGPPLPPPLLLPLPSVQNFQRAVKLTAPTVLSLQQEPPPGLCFSCSGQTGGAAVDDGQLALIV